MNKNLPLFALLFLFSFGVFAQEAYYVIHTKGEIKKDGETINYKDKISPEDKLTFGSDGDFLVVFSSENGRKIIRPVNEEKESDSFVAYFVKENLFPLQKQVATRGTGGLSNVQEVKNYFSTPIAIINQHKIEYNQAKMELDNTHFLVFKDSDLQYQLKVDEDYIILDSSTPLGLHRLFFIDSSFGTTLELCDAHIFKIDLAQLKSELAYYEELTGTKFTAETLKKYLNETYGKFSPEEFAMVMN
jgi:hypothetical protein